MAMVGHDIRMLASWVPDATPAPSGGTCVPGVNGIVVAMAMAMLRSFRPSRFTSWRVAGGSRAHAVVESFAMSTVESQLPAPPWVP